MTLREWLVRRTAGWLVIPVALIVLAYTIHRVNMRGFENTRNITKLTAEIVKLKNAVPVRDMHLEAIFGTREAEIREHEDELLQFLIEANDADIKELQEFIKELKSKGPKHMRPQGVEFDGIDINDIVWPEGSFEVTREDLQVKADKDPWPPRITSNIPQALVDLYSRLEKLEGKEDEKRYE